MKDVLKIYFTGLFIFLFTSIAFHFLIRTMFRMIGDEPHNLAVFFSVVTGVAGIVLYAYLLHEKSKNGGL